LVHGHQFAIQVEGGGFQPGHGLGDYLKSAGVIRAVPGEKAHTGAIELTGGQLVEDSRAVQGGGAGLNLGAGSFTPAEMREQCERKLPKWPFTLGDALLLGAAWLIWSRNGEALGQWELAAFVFCVAAGAILSVLPFVLEYRAMSRLAETDALAAVMAETKRLETFAAQVGTATGQWQYVQEQAEKTAKDAGEAAQRMAAELKTFSEFMERANDSEKANLRLEVEKLRRAEGDWMTVLVRVLDHTFALHQGALKSGQPNVIQQVGNFQNACREAARRVGLTPFIAQPAEPFDAQRHKSAGGESEVPAGALVTETLATGFTFQGRIVRPALVRLGTNGAEPQPA
jgi:molecular chaperone GrpE (heat shock protein)